jgi:hypothetical protein
MSCLNCLGMSFPTKKRRDIVLTALDVCYPKSGGYKGVKFCTNTYLHSASLTKKLLNSEGVRL